MLRGKLKLVGILIVSVFTLSGCFGGGFHGEGWPWWPSPIDRSGDITAVSELYDLLFEADDFQSLLQHFADPFRYELTVIRDGQVDHDESESDEVTHAEALASRAAAALPFGELPDDWEAGDVLLDVRDHIASTSQTLQKVWDRQVEGGNITVILKERETLSVTTTWVKESGEWFLTEISVTRTYECLNCATEEDASEVGELYRLLFDADDLETLLEHFADPFTFDATQIQDGMVTIEDSKSISHDEVLDPEPHHWLVEWFASEFPTGENILIYDAGELVVEVLGDVATTSQSFDRMRYETNIFHATIIISTTWSKATGNWLLIKLTVVGDEDCYTCVPF